MSTTPRQPDSARRSMLTLDDLAQDLVWPKLFRAGPLSLHPIRMLAALVTVALVAAVISLVAWIERSLGWSGSPESRQHLLDLLGPPIAPDLPPPVPGGPAGERLMDLFFSVPLQLVRVHPLLMLLGLPISMVLVVWCMGAISRTAATEFTGGRAEGMSVALGFSRRRLASMVGALIGPLVVVWAVALLLALAGLVLARLPGVNLLGAILYGVAFLGGLFASFIMLVYLACKPLLIPGVCCDGADAMDAIQRAYAYVLAKPLRFALYFLIVVAQGLLLLSLVALLMAATVSFTARATGRWAGDHGRPMVHGERAPIVLDSNGLRVEPTTRDRLFNAGASIVRFWNGIPALLPLAFLLSYMACSATIVYLAMRRICDGQDMNELWSPREDREGALGAGAASEADADAE